MIAEAGHYALALALIQAVVPIAGARLRDPVLMNVGCATALAQMAFAIASFAALVTLHVTSDFSVVNVYENAFPEAAHLQNYRRVGESRTLHAALGSDPCTVRRARRHVQQQPSAAIARASWGCRPGSHPPSICSS
jgi:hypothetical protein